MATKVDINIDNKVSSGKARNAVSANAEAVSSSLKTGTVAAIKKQLGVQ